MSQERIHPLEELLRIIAREAPQPWYPRQYLRGAADEAEHVSQLLEYLSLEGLIKKVPGPTIESGAGVVLTPLGEQALSDPALMARLVRGEPIREGDTGAVIRQSLRTRTRPIVTQVIVAINVLVFVYGLILAAGVPKLANTYLIGFSGDPTYWNLQHKLGSVRVIDIQRGEYWRLMSSTLVHGGVLHILMNMYTLWGAGAFVEQTWGRWRMLVIYLVSGWAGSCLAMAFMSNAFIPLVGASGAICGVLAAEAAWVFLYGRHLPQEMAARGRSQVFTTLLLIVIMSLLPGVSGWAHLGGAIGGLLAAVFLHLQRFGYPGVRWAALVLVAALPVASFVQMQRARAGKPAVVRDDKEDKQDRKKDAKKQDKDDPPAGVSGPFLRHYAEPLSETADALLRTCERVPLDPDKARADANRPALMARIIKHRAALDELEAALKKERYADERLENGRAEALKLIKAGKELCGVATTYLEEPTARSKDKVKSQFGSFDDQAAEFEALRKKLREL